ncbi:MAG: S8/S53 family peptidase [Chloroflexota bacterium]
MKNRIVLLVTLIIFLLASCGAPQEARIVRHPEPVDYNGYNTYITAPTYNPDSDDPWQMDLRSADLTGIDFSNSLDDLYFATFDSKTIWPSPELMPDNFDWQSIIELGEDPGLGIRQLHEQGISGEGVGIAIIDQALLVDHVEYVDRVLVYEEADNISGGWRAVSMHGAAVASIAVGKTVGVAPDADLYFIASTMCNQGTYESIDFACLAENVRRIIEINKSLPEERKIRVLSMSIGWGPESKGYDEITAAVNEARDAGIFVISTSISDVYGLKFHGLGRFPLSDPNVFQSYEPGSWWQNIFYEQGLGVDTLLVPMDSRATASPTGLGDYVFYRQGGWSWCVPYLAGMYALAVQVNHDITPEEFWSTALETGQTIQIEHDGKSYSLGVILDPQALITALQE